MLITFKSAASGDVIFLEKTGQKMLDVLHKDRNATKGIVTVEQLPDTIARVRQAIAADVAEQAGLPPGDNTEETPDADLSFHQRGLPLLELLERSLAEKAPVTWGV
ncbi:DUF1840 domain-containing protein [Zoogloeaceae bacterium G21618-S1]|nr:DUF1840 domain-containing protein [Zoogloeaceae bacterium G21618-S1]